MKVSEAMAGHRLMMMSRDGSYRVWRIREAPNRLGA